MAEAAAATTAPAPAKGGSTKLLLIILIVLLLVGMGGGAAWFFLGGGNHAASGPAAPSKPKEPVFVPMETLTVNLQPEEGNDRYLQIGITFKSFDKHAEEQIKTYTPELRSKVLMLLASKTPTELYPADGKVKLAKEIVELCEHVFKAVGKESPEEIDALLKGVSDDADDDPVEAADPSGIRSYNLGSQERIVRGRMPTLEIINERFARNWRIGLFNFMRRNAEISVGPVKVQKYSEFIRNLVVPTSLNLVHVKPLRGTALFVFDPNLIFLVVDNLFGGDGRFHMRVEGRDFTDVEQRIIQRMLHLVFEHYAKAWQPVYPIDFEFLRMEMHTEFANVATPNEVVITTSFSIELGSNGGDVHICMPYTMIEPIRDRLTSAIQGEALEVDKRWLRLLSQQVQTAEVELIADLATAKVQVSDILNMKVGDVIPLELDDSVTAKVDGVPVMECNYGTFNGQYALRVNRMLNMSGSESATESDDDN
ncbi:hypothetical protein DL763_009897 [Monosporascus cannonballus]|nr:hypothetical protein DL763_009897 [Monosporascus cannonballus]